MRKNGEKNESKKGDTVLYLVQGLLSALPQVQANGVRAPVGLNWGFCKGLARLNLMERLAADVVWMVSPLPL